jgi:diaminopimelate epimerase
MQAMSKIKFWKYQANGNDFVIVNDFNGNIHLTGKQIQHICDRHFGIGADGFIVLMPSDIYDFEMYYYNSDGKLGSMCGNGGRCAAMFAFFNEFADEQMKFKAYDGIHEAIIKERLQMNLCDVSLSLSDISEVEKNKHYYFLHTGSPHYVEFVDNLAEIDVIKEGRKTRYSEKFMPEGTNVNFAEFRDDRLFVRTYERGVENETLSCGTGVTASAIASFYLTGKTTQIVHTTGGEFIITFEPQDHNSFTNVRLRGPAELVFEGLIDV